MKKQIERECLSTLPVQTKQGEKATYARFQLKDSKTGDYFQCIAFSSNAESLAKELTEPGINIIIRGRQDDDSFIINSFKIKRPDKEILSEDINIRIAGSHEKLIDLQKRIKEYYGDHLGQVKVKWGDTWQWFEKDDCVEINGTWWHKVEFVMNQLGAEYVLRRYKEFVGGGTTNDLVNCIQSSLYEKFRNDLVMEANGQKPLEEPRSVEKHPESIETIKLEDGTEVEIL